MLKLIVSTASSQQATEDGFCIHPTLLHMSIKEKGKIVCETELETSVPKFPLDWKLIFLIREGKVFYRHNYEWKTDKMEFPCSSIEHYVGDLVKISENDIMA